MKRLNCMGLDYQDKEPAFWRGKRRLGGSLVEVVIAGVVLAMCAVTASGLLLSIFTVPRKASVKHEMILAGRKLREELKSYVTADVAVTHSAPGNPPWHLPQDSSCNNCWALEPGGHDATSMLSDELRAKGATMKYVVTRQRVGGRILPKVDITLKWDD